MLHIFRRSLVSLICAWALMACTDDGGTVTSGPDALEDGGAVSDGDVSSADSVLTDGGTLDGSTPDVAGDVQVEPNDIAADIPSDIEPADAGPETSPEDVDPGDSLPPADDTSTDAAADVGGGDSEVSPDDADDVSDSSETTEPEETPPFDEAIPAADPALYTQQELYAMQTDSESRVNLFWRGTRVDGGQDLLVSRSDSLVTDFGEPTVIAADVTTAGITSGGDLHLQGETYYLTWRDDKAPYTIRFRRGTWPDIAGADVILAETWTTLWRPHLAWLSDTTGCVIWQQGEDIQMRCTEDGGVTFGDVVQVDEPADTATVSTAAFLITGELVVAYHMGVLGNNDIRVVRSPDLGGSWEQATEVGGDTVGYGLVSQGTVAGNHVYPSMIYALSGTLHLAWHRTLPGLEAVAYHTTSEDGLVWTEPAILPVIQSHVELVAGRQGELHVSGVDAELGFGDTHYMSSLDDGLTWGEPTVISTAADLGNLSHLMDADLLEGWLHIAFWGQDTHLNVVTVEPK